MTTTHGHVESGLAGYGPENDDGFYPYANATEAASAASSELETFIDMAHEVASIAADFAQRARDEDNDTLELDQLREYLQESKRADELDILARNLDSDARAKAPIFLEDSALLESTMRAVIEGYVDNGGNVHTGAPWDVSYNTRLYVWECSETECSVWDDAR
jgi:hypothetical protein